MFVSSVKSADLLFSVPVFCSEKDLLQTQTFIFKRLQHSVLFHDPTEVHVAIKLDDVLLRQKLDVFQTWKEKMDSFRSDLATFFGSSPQDNLNQI